MIYFLRHFLEDKDIGEYFELSGNVFCYNAYNSRYRCNFISTSWIIREILLLEGKIAMEKMDNQSFVVTASNGCSAEFNIKDGILQIKTEKSHDFVHGLNPHHATNDGTFPAFDDFVKQLLKKSFAAFVTVAIFMEYCTIETDAGEREMVISLTHPWKFSAKFVFAENGTVFLSSGWKKPEVTDSGLLAGRNTIN